MMSENISTLFSQLAQNVHNQWASKSFNEDDFPTLAESCLQQQKMHLKVNRKTLIDWILAATSITTQTNINTHFGDFKFTVFANGRFYIDVLFWLDGTTSIHQHAFNGAFTVIEGNSIHSNYSFIAQQQINRSFLIGQTKFQNIEILQTGDIRKIIPKQMSAHSLFHLDSPTISLIVRTYGEKYAHPQLSYLKPHIARYPFETPTEIIQKIRTLKMLAKLNKQDYLNAYLQHITNLDFYSHIEIFIANVIQLHEFEALTDAIAQFKHKNPQLVPMLQAVAKQMIQTNQIIAWRRKIKDPDTKFFLAILLNSPNKQTSFQLIEQKYPDRIATELIIDWIKQLIKSEGLENFDITEQALPFIDCLLNGYAFEQTLEQLAADYEQHELDENREVLAHFYQQIKYESVLSSLFLSAEET